MDSLSVWLSIREWTDFPCTVIVHGIVAFYLAWFAATFIFGTVTNHVTRSDTSFIGVVFAIIICAIVFPIAFAISFQGIFMISQLTKIGTYVAMVDESVIKPMSPAICACLTVYFIMCMRAPPRALRHSRAHSRESRA